MRIIIAAAISSMLFVGTALCQEHALDISLSAPDHTSDGGHIKGKATNVSGHELAEAMIKFNLYDAQGNLVGNAFDIVDHLEPGIVWSFDAIATKPFSTCKIVEVLP